MPYVLFGLFKLFVLSLILSFFVDALQMSMQSNNSVQFGTVNKGAVKKDAVKKDAVNEDALCNNVFPPRRMSAANVSLPLCIGHRGYSAKWPENTLLSIIEALKEGANGIETDLRMSADHQLLLNHDTTLERTTNGTGEISKLRWYNHMEFVRTLQGNQPIAKLKDLLSLLRFTTQFSAVKKLIIDIKDDNPIEILDHLKELLDNMDLLKEEDVLLDTLVDFKCIRDSNDPNLVGNKPLGSAWKSPIVIGIWNMDYFQRAKQLFPDYEICLIAAFWPPIYIPRYPISHPWAVEFDSLSIDYNHLSSHLVAQAHKHHRAVYSWTINDNITASYASQYHADAVLTDDVPMCVSIFSK